MLRLVILFVGYCLLTISSRAETVVVCNYKVHIRQVLKETIENSVGVSPEVKQTFAIRACGKMELEGIIALVPNEVIYSGERVFQLFEVILGGRPIYVLRMTHRPLPDPTGPTEVL